MDRSARAGRYFAMMRYEHRLMAAAICCIAFTCCKKEADVRPPVVTIIAPASGFDLSVPDTLHVVADVSGEEDIDQVMFTVSNANGIPILESLTVVPASNPARLEVGIPITSDLITSGDYTLTVLARSGEATGKDRTTIGLVGTPLRLRRILVIGQPDAGSVSISVIDSTGAVSLANTILMDLGGGAISSAGRTCAVMGSVQGPLMALAPNGVQVPWQKPNLGNSGIPWFTSLDLCEDGRYYVGTTDGNIRGYNAMSGATEHVSDLAPGQRARVAAIVDEHLVVAQVDQTGSAWRLGIHQASSGSLVSEQALDKSVVAMFRRTDTDVLLFGDRDGHGVVEDHNLDGGGGWEPYSWPSGFAAVERVDDDTFLVALVDGALERFTYSNAGSVTIANIADMRDLVLDPVSGLVHVAAGDGVVAVDPGTGQVVANYPIGIPVRYVLPLLNR